MARKNARRRTDRRGWKVVKIRFFFHFSAAFPGYFGQSSCWYNPIRDHKIDSKRSRRKPARPLRLLIQAGGFFRNLPGADRIPMTTGPFSPRIHQGAKFHKGLASGLPRALVTMLKLGPVIKASVLYFTSKVFCLLLYARIGF